VKALLVALVGLLLGGWAIPLGFVIGLSPLGIYLAAVAGGLIGGIAFLLLGDHMSTWLRTRHERDTGSGPSMPPWLGRVVDTYGSRGLGLVGPLILGVTASVIACVALDLDRGPFVRWMTVSIVGLYGVYVLGLVVITELI
jgi:hypothetical protein